MDGPPPQPERPEEPAPNRRDPPAPDPGEALPGPDDPAPERRGASRPEAQGESHPEAGGELDPEAPGQLHPQDLSEEERGELSFLRPFSDEDAHRLLRRYLSELQSGSRKLTPQDRAKLALLIEFCVEDD